METAAEIRRTNEAGVRRWPWMDAMCAALVYIALSYTNALSPLLLRRYHTPSVLLVGSVALTIAYMAVHLWLVRGLSAPRIRPVQSAAVVVVSAAIVCWSLFLGHLPRGPRAGLVIPWVWLALVLASVLLGVLVSRIIREPALLIPAALVGGLVDLWGVSYGTTHAALQHKPELVARLSVPVPVAPGFARLVTIGPADFLFLGLFFACIQRFGMNIGGTYRACLVLLTATVLLVVPHFDVPALVPIGIAVLVANWSFLRLSRSEKFAMLYGLLFMAALIGLFAWLKPYG